MFNLTLQYRNVHSATKLYKYSENCNRCYKNIFLVLKNIKIVVDLSFAVCRFGSGGYKVNLFIDGKM